ncbi:unnamed protein product [Rotaria sp. Silwood1]|nr:unnamed protein product [Rotaria sp. Silwood1]CAF0991778.1 unnamed protein product [Rotaria sp. Silwood1]CAF4531649.1 unnamed protein product [Rotaria sp. Silwood1]
MYYANMNIINHNKSSSSEQKSSFVRDVSNQTFDITKDFQEDNDDNQNRFPDTTSAQILTKNEQHVKRENMIDKSKTNIIDQTLIHSNLIVRANNLERSNRKHVLINIHPEIRTSSHQRPNRSIVASALAIILLIIIITTIVYIVIIIVKKVPHINSLSFYKPPRL